MQTTTQRITVLALAALFAVTVVACAIDRSGSLEQHRWWSGLGPVLPHDSFPGDCQLCHQGDSWWSLREDFTFDHEAETGYALEGAHAFAQCLRCHNDRGPVETFEAQGCAGCHERLHQNLLDTDCTTCHNQNNWRPDGMFALHQRTRFPLVGVHAVTSCRRCHIGAEVGRFLPVDVECVTCHQADLLQANNPNHLGLGWVDNCDRCHLPTTWNQAEIDS